VERQPEKSLLTVEEDVVADVEHDVVSAAIGPDDPTDLFDNEIPPAGWIGT